MPRTNSGSAMRWADSSDEKGDVAMKDMGHAGHNDGKVARVVTQKMMAPVPKEKPVSVPQGRLAFDDESEHEEDKQEKDEESEEDQ